jgi:hypothetical protein
VDQLVFVEVGGKAGAADDVAAGVGQVARAERVGAMAFAKAAVRSFREVVRIKCTSASHNASVRMVVR